MAKRKLSYSEALEQIETILEQIETGELDVDVLGKKVKQAAELIKLCKTKLHTTEEEVQKIIDDIES